MRLSDRRYERDARRYVLALRFLRCGARPQTIVRWTGLSSYRVETMLDDHPAQSFRRTPHRPRGVAPYRVATFFASPQHRRETLTLAALFVALHLTPPREDLKRLPRFPNFQCGELLCSSYEAFKALLPKSILTIDHAALLAVALTKGDELALRLCEVCGGILVRDKLALEIPPCVYCEQEAAEAQAETKAETEGEDEASDRQSDPLSD